jgi:hypothetical protein
MWKRVRPLVTVAIIYIYIDVNISIKLDTNLKLQSVNINQLSDRNIEKRGDRSAFEIEMHLYKWTIRQVVQSEHAH